MFISLFCCFLKYLGNISLQLKRTSKKVQNDTHLYHIKLRKCLLSLKSSFDSNLRSYVLNERICCGCNSAYVKRTCRHMTTRILEHQKTKSPVEQHVVEFCGALTTFDYKNIGLWQDTKTLMTIEFLHPSRRKPQLNTRDEYKSREITMKY